MLRNPGVRRRGPGLISSTATGAGVAELSHRRGPGLDDEAIAQLRKLGDLKKEGLLTEEEFRAQKQRLLS